MRYVCSDCTKPGAKKVFRTRTLPVDCAECQRMIQIYHSDEDGGFEAESAPDPHEAREAPNQPPDEVA